MEDSDTHRAIRLEQVRISVSTCFPVCFALPLSCLYLLRITSLALSLHSPHTALHSTTQHHIALHGSTQHSRTSLYLGALIRP
jgi:hypothetical protein